MKTKFYTFSLLLALSLSAQAALYPFSGPFNNNGGAGDNIIPDNSGIGLSDAHTLSGLGISLSSVTLSLTLQNGLGTDLSGYLRLGNTMSSPSYDLTSFLGSLTLSGTPTPYTLNVSSAFGGYDPNDTWTLFLADGVPLDVTLLSAWSLDITAVPEPTNVALGIFASGAVLVLAIRERKKIRQLWSADAKV